MYEGQVDSRLVRPAQTTNQGEEGRLPALRHGEIRAPDEMGRPPPPCPPLHANFLDIKAGAMGLRRLVACGDLLGAWTPDNYVPIKFNDCPLFRSANARASLPPRPLPSPPYNTDPGPLFLDRAACATESATTIIPGLQSNYFLILSGWAWNRAAFAECRATTL